MAEESPAGIRGTRKKLLAWGVFAGAFYIAVAVISFRSGLIPVRPLLDGLGPPEPYRWIDPPPELREGNQQPLTGNAEIPLGPTGSEPLSVTTSDGQAAVTLAAESIPPKPGESAIRVSITPLDPTDLPDAPKGLNVEGNAYRIEAKYAPSGSTTVLNKPATLILRFPIQADTILRQSDSGWTKLETHLAAASMQLFGDSEQLGTFAAAGKPVVPPEPPGTPAWVYLAAGLTLTAVVAFILLVRRPSTTKPAAASRKRR